MTNFHEQCVDKMLRDDLGKAAYEAYCEQTNWKSIRGEQLPTWDEQTENNPKIAFAWCEAAKAVEIIVAAEMY